MGAPNEADSLFREAAGYLRPEDVHVLESAYRFSAEAHEGQFRKTGEPYVSHPVEVAKILTAWHLDSQALTAALLHDVMEDTEVTKAQLSERFGRMVAELVDGVSKLDRIEFESQEQAQAENFRKMVLAMTRDVRVILIKLADRLHNMRTLEAMAAPKRARIARETLDIYAPIANRLGLNALYQELQELSFKHLFPNRYRVLQKALQAARGNRREVVDRILNAIRDRLAEELIEAQVQGREKNLFSIYRKMEDKSLTFSQVFDIFGFRVITRDVAGCYLALGALHGLYKPIPGKFKDYIAIPKANGYQSLHTTLFGPFGMPIEVQIRTADMHRIAEAGVASHWLYKQSDSDLTDLQRKTHLWLQSLLEMQTRSGSSVEFLEHLKVDLFPDEVYVFTPKGRILSLSQGSTCVDFAYAVHTDIGNRCVAARINGELVPLRSELRNGDRVEIITTAHAKPNPAWLNYVVTAKARSSIRHFLKTMQYEESAQLGERLLQQAVSAIGGKDVVIDEAQWERYARDHGNRPRLEVLADIGLGKLLAIVVARQLLRLGEQEGGSNRLPGTVVIRGSEGMALQFAKCCHPIPGDPIIGYVKKGQGLVVHTHDCPVARKMRGDPDKWLDVEWSPDTRKLFAVNIRMVVSNQRGVLAKLAAEIAEAGSNIDNVSLEPGDSSAYSNIHFTLQVNNRLHLAHLMRGLRRIPEVIRITRLKG
ncbi:MAG: bifunctional (p)ppGpp synthetase/guanosine-3',5'-bis(diphosphate) 3'-pyrophosphohydrolase [Rhodocyclaceae bacterium]|nr:bifunctional (p)ppGpp synthetase/guanosine-3',5'-bis(diphosphate) 3'-pyrophosphohydrolase [Rhodocyclaceae bacterium]MCA3147336.1 bifunctional (p)ppGpp synthetase/guanosine-3',5'-bis(diphosphate) 3'-pyrophosphohydrolase [Rhodocyclaceae bacterium]